MVGVGQIRILSHTAPCEFVFLGIGHIVLAFAGRNPIQVETAVKAHCFRRGRHLFLAQLHRQLRKDNVAGFRQAVFETNIPMPAQASDLVAVHRDLPLAVEGAGIQIRDIFDGGRTGDDLENRAGRIRCRERPVEVNTFVLPGGVGIEICRYVARVKGRRAHHAEQFARLVVV